MMPTLEKPYADLFLKKVDLLVRQSFQREIVLRSKQEPARIRLCIQIAHERLSKKLSLPKLSMEKLPLPIKQYEGLLEQFRQELAPYLKKYEDQERDKNLSKETIYKLCDKMKIHSKINYFIQALEESHKRYPHVYDRKGLVAGIFIVMLLYLRGEQNINREDKEEILFILGIDHMKKKELKYWINFVKEDNDKYKWIDSIFEKINESMEIDTAMEIKPQRQAVSGVGMMIHPQIDFYGDKHYSEYLKWKKSILEKISLIKESMNRINE
ncbi:hypothetical protein MERGE_002429 [Pneumocystis wakefieldiae]|uniref:ORC6 first cyclin-like domain-containing protein n=1 Tax=Pneumocystis wakefieldiae TaxID=38082 RepID=A0A899FXV0_9ASCO|nr:hypothetical protein MERGE_002429 [Pneumocystis wakefieldiae]